MSLLRIYASLTAPPQHCQWALIEAGAEPVAGEGPVAKLPHHAERVQLIIPAAQVFITRARLPRDINHRAGSLLAFAIEEQIAGEPDANQVCWLGEAGGDTDDGAGGVEAVLAVVDKQGLKAWCDALNESDIRGYEIHCETLLLPIEPGEWSLAWDGQEGFVRTGPLQGSATDAGDSQSPPLSLQLAVEEALARDAPPGHISIYATAPDALPDLEEWQRSLGVTVSDAGFWDWRSAAPDSGVSMALERRRWYGLRGLLTRLKPAAWIAASALALHTAFLATDWALLARQQKSMSQQIAQRFHSVFPDAVAVVDPVLQMRRKLAEARHAAGQSDSGDFLPMISKVTAGLSGLPAGTLRIVSYENGRMTLEFAGIDDARLRGIVTRLVQSGLAVDTAPPRSPGGADSRQAPVRGPVITVRST